MNEREAIAVQEPGEAFYNAQQRFVADELVQQIRAADEQADAWEADLADPAVVPQLLDHAERAFGPVEVLINNAAVSGAPTDTFTPTNQPLHDHFQRIVHTITAQSHDRHFAVNNRATALLMAEFARRHAERGATWGRIVNGSTDGASAFSGEVSYGASKYAMENFSRAAAVEFGPLGITVNIVSPEPIQTGWLPPADEQNVSGIPLGRMGKPENVADVIVLLASK